MITNNFLQHYAVGSLNFIWKSKQISLDAKMKLYLAMPVNLDLWDGETWSGNTLDLKLLENFHHRKIWKMLGTSMLQVKNERSTRKQRWRRLNKIESLLELWTFCMLKFICRTACQKSSALSRKFLSVCVNNELSIRRKFHKSKDALVESLHSLIPNMPKLGHFKYWFGHASDATK